MFPAYPIKKLCNRKPTCLFPRAIPKMQPDSMYPYLDLPLILQGALCVATVSKYTCDSCIAHHCVCIFDHQERDNPPSMLSILATCTTCQVKRHSCIKSTPGDPCVMCLKSGSCCEFGLSTQGRRIDIQPVTPFLSNKTSSISVTKDQRRHA